METFEAIFGLYPFFFLFAFGVYVLHTFNDKNNNEKWNDDGWSYHNLIVQQVHLFASLFTYLINLQKIAKFTDFFSAILRFFFQSLQQFSISLKLHQKKRHATEKRATVNCQIFFSGFDKSVFGLCNKPNRLSICIFVICSEIQENRGRFAIFFGARYIKTFSDLSEYNIIK